MSRVFETFKVEGDDNYLGVNIPSRNIRVLITRTDEGVVVDLFPIGSDEVIASTWATKNEATPDEETE
jgi:hypothetical protein